MEKDKNKKGRKSNGMRNSTERSNTKGNGFKQNPNRDEEGKKHNKGSFSKHPQGKGRSRNRTNSEESTYGKGKFNRNSSEESTYGKGKFNRNSSEGNTYGKGKFNRNSSEGNTYGKGKFNRNSSEGNTYEKGKFKRSSAGDDTKDQFSKSNFEERGKKRKSGNKKGGHVKTGKNRYADRELANKKSKKRSNDASINIPEYNFNKIKKVKDNKRKQKENAEEQGGSAIRLNRFIANAGVCSRREADTLIEKGEVRVNGRVVTEMGFKVKSLDRVEYKGQVLRRERKVYVLLNKPRGFLTTTDDPEGRRTIMELVNNACNERIYPVGRLDRNTSGLLLLTNDGELATSLTHPSGNVKKVYRVELNTEITPEHFEALREGIELEDGAIKPDDIAVNDVDKRVLGVEIHSGRNRIVRRMFEHFGYEVDKLDRTSFAGLTKKNIPRGHWRYLSEGELVRLKHFEKF